MRTTCAFLLTACLVGMAASARAQDVPVADGPSPATLGGPLAHSAAREAARLAAVPGWINPAETPSQAPTGPAAALELKWSELGSVIMGRTIMLVVPGGATITGEVIALREDVLLLEIKNTSNRVAYPGPGATIPRESISQLTVERRRGSWGRNLGTTIGVLTGVVVGAYVAGTVADSAGTGIPLFLAIASGITVGGYHVGRAADTNRTVIRVVP